MPIPVEPALAADLYTLVFAELMGQETVSAYNVQDSYTLAARCCKKAGVRFHYHTTQMGRWTGFAVAAPNASMAGTACVDMA